MKFESSDPPRLRMESDVVEDMDGVLASFFVQRETINKCVVAREIGGRLCGVAPVGSDMTMLTQHISTNHISSSSASGFGANLSILLHPTSTTGIPTYIIDNDYRRGFCKLSCP